MTSARKAALFGIVAASLALGAASLFAELALRAIDGSGFGLRLRQPDPVAPPTATGSIDVNAKWLAPSLADAYVKTLPVADGVDRAWFAEDPPAPVVDPIDPALAARADAHPGFELSSVYEWNEAYVRRALCVEEKLRMPVFSNVRDLFMYQPPDGDIYPQFRFLRGVRYKSRLQTNAFGWRGPAVDLVKPRGTVRLAFVGASTTIDPHADTFSHPEYVAQWLNRWAQARQQSVRFEVINAGREGIDAQGVAAVVRQEILPVRPDFVVDYEGGNQFWPSELVKGALPPRPTNTAQPWAIEKYSALAVRVRRAMRRVGEGTEPVKPRLSVEWPADLDEKDPSLADPRLPVTLPKIVRAMDDMRTALAGIGAAYVPSSFVWFVKPGMVLDRRRDSGIYDFLNDAYWPFSYAHMRRHADFQNRVFRKFAAVHDLPFVDLAASYPLDPRLFFDAVHMTPAGIKLKAWIIVQQLVPEIERRLRDGRLPAADPGGRTSHPAFTGAPPRLVALDDIRRSCPGARDSQARQ